MRREQRAGQARGTRSARYAEYVLFTLLMDYRGGTYISQVEAESAKQAVQRWARNLGPRPIAEFGAKRKRELVADLKNDSVVPLGGLKNAWCTSGLTSGGLAMVNIVATADTAKRYE